jgi:hypothetical protein
MQHTGGWAVDRVRWIEHKGKRILFEDFSGLQETKDIYEVTDTSTAIICKQPRASVLLLTDVTGAHYSPSIMKRLKDNSKLTVPYMKAYVIVGVKGLTLTVLQSFVAFTGLDVKLCDTLEEGKEWLVGQ